MQRSICVVAIVLFAGGAASAAQPQSCVTPKAAIARGALARTWIRVYAKPSNRAAPMSYTVASPLGMWVIGTSGGFLHVTTGDSMAGWPFKPRADLGWVRAGDVQEQAIRNCT